MTARTDWQALPVAADGHFAAIGDVHGRSDLLKATFDRLDTSLPSSAEIVLLGDLIDRGPDSLGTLDLAMKGCGGRPVRAICGNHESMALSGIFEPDPDIAFGAAYIWVRNGGSTVIEETGVRGWPSGQELADAIGAERVAFLKSMLPHHRSGNVLFAHAGIDPRQELAPQLAQPIMDFTSIEGEDYHTSMRWIREPWVGYPGSLEETAIGEDLFVVYGHTIQKGVLLTRCQVGIDLGAYARGILGVCEIDHDRMRFHFMEVEPAHEADLSL